MTTTKSKVSVSSNGHVEIKVINSNELPVWTRTTKYAPYVEKFKSLNKGQAILIEPTKLVQTIYSLLKKRGNNDIATRVHEGKGYILKTA